MQVTCSDCPIGLSILLSYFIYKSFCPWHKILPFQQKTETVSTLWYFLESAFSFIVVSKIMCSVVLLILSRSRISSFLSKNSKTQKRFISFIFLVSLFGSYFSSITFISLMVPFSSFLSVISKFKCVAVIASTSPSFSRYDRTITFFVGRFLTGFVN